MPRILQADVDEVKARTRIDEIIGERVALRSAGVGSLKGLCPFHDEIVFQAHKDEVFDVLSAVHRCMTSNYGGMPFNCDSSIAIGRDFSCPIEIGEEVNVEKVQAALDELFGGET